MNRNELKETWEALNQKGLASQSESEMQKIIGFGTSKTVAHINKKLVRHMAITGLASVVSTFGVIFFYLVFDPVKHPWVDLSKIIPIQILGFTIFLVLFLLGWLEYRLVNKKFTPESVKVYIAGLLRSLKHYRRLFMIIVLGLLTITFYVELSYFMAMGGLLNLLLKLGCTGLLTVVSYFIMRWFYSKSFGPYLTDLSIYQKELES